MERIKLKGGSLSGTYECRDRGRHFIRKQVSLTENREFGFYRWFSQLKKLQRLGRLFPELFPKVIGVGIEGGMSYFDLEFIEKSVTAHAYLVANPSRAGVDEFFSAFLSAMERLHTTVMPSYAGAFDLYLNQEVTHALAFCMEDPTFASLAQHKKVRLNGREVPSLITRLDEFKELALTHYTNPGECLTHGNITLENLLYVPKEKRVVFIDLYEENYADTIWNEYSQILQSCHGMYELYNAANPHVEGNAVTAEIAYAPGLDAFNQKFQKFLTERLSRDELMVTRLYEVSQFTRMLPFKKTIARDKMALFYALASVLFEDCAR